jgi:hypothetical protein
MSELDDAITWAEFRRSDSFGGKHMRTLVDSIKEYRRRELLPITQQYVDSVSTTTTDSDPAVPVVVYHNPNFKGEYDNHREVRIVRTVSAGLIVERYMNHDALGNTSWIKASPTLSNDVLTQYHRESDEARIIKLTVPPGTPPTDAVQDALLGALNSIIVSCYSSPVTADSINAALRCFKNVLKYGTRSAAVIGLPIDPSPRVIEYIDKPSSLKSSLD